MKFPTLREISQINHNIHKRREARYKSQEEKQFTLGSTAGMLLMWNSNISNEKISFENAISENKNENIQVGLPAEIGWLIGSYLNRKDAANVAKTCKNANDSGKNAINSFIEKNGKSYKEESYHRFMFPIF